MNIKIFADGADLQSIIEQSKDPLIKGFTTNPTLMRKAGIDNYTQFALQVLGHLKTLPTKKSISFEVFADDFPTMAQQALTISSWGVNSDVPVYVKIPITNTKGESAIPLIRSLSADGVMVNVTAITTHHQILEAVSAITPNTGAIISVFCGRIADTGVDPIPMMSYARVLCDGVAGTELLWASPREVLNIKQANDCGCDIITVTGDLIKKMSLFGKDLEEYSLETVKMFYNDAQAAGFTI